MMNLNVKTIWEFNLKASMLIFYYLKNVLTVLFHVVDLELQSEDGITTFSSTD